MHPLKFVPVSFGTIENFDDRVACQGNSIPRYRLLSIIKISIVTTLATTERLPFQVYTRNCLIWQEESGIWILDIMIPREYWARTPNATRHLPYFFCPMPSLQAHTSLLQNKKYLNLTAHILAWNFPAKVFQNRDAEIEISLLRTHVDQSWPFWMPAGRDSIREWRKLNHWLIFSR